MIVLFRKYLFYVSSVTMYADAKNGHFNHILLYNFKKGKRVEGDKRKICSVNGNDAITEPAY